MLPNVTELILITIIIMIVFGAGRLTHVASFIGKMRVNFRKGLTMQEPIDITPAGSGASSTHERKPGKLSQAVEEAQLDGSSLEDKTT